VQALLLVTSSRPPLRADSTFWRFCAVSQVIWELCCALPACLRPLPLPCIAACMCFQFQSHSMHLSCLTAPRLLAYLALARSSASCAYLLLPQRPSTAVTSAQKLVSCVCIPVLPVLPLGGPHVSNVTSYPFFSLILRSTALPQPSLTPDVLIAGIVKA
jgi:hypothetical protein